MWKAPEGREDVVNGLLASSTDNQEKDQENVLPSKESQVHKREDRLGMRVRYSLISESILSVQSMVRVDETVAGLTQRDPCSRHNGCEGDDGQVRALQNCEGHAHKFICGQ